MTADNEIAQLDYSKPPPGIDPERLPRNLRLTLQTAGVWGPNALAEAWLIHKATNPPPGLRPHPWRDMGKNLGRPFAHAFVTPRGYTIPGTVSVDRPTALMAAWRHYDLRLALATSGKAGAFDWPGVLDDHDIDLLASVNRRCAAEAADRG